MKKKLFPLACATLAVLLSPLTTACGKNNSQSTSTAFSFNLSFKGSATRANLPVGSKDTIEIRESNAAGTEEYEFYLGDINDATYLAVDAQTGEVEAMKYKEDPILVYCYEATNDITKGIEVQIVESGLSPVTGGKSYSALTYDDKANILGKLEEYAMDNHLTGISLFEDGGYVMYNPRIQKGTDNYIAGYGFGILAEGSITADLPTETKSEWKRYYHSATSLDPQKINALNASGSDVSDLYDYIASSYWSVKMNETKNGYEWYPSLAKDFNPTPIDLDPNTQKATTWKFHVRTGADGLKYDTNSQYPAIAAFKGREVTIDDYVYAFKHLLTGGFNQYRGTELAGEDTYGIVGASAYYNATKNKTDVDDELFERTVQVKSGTDAGGAYLQIQLTSAVNTFYAKYVLSSSLYEPLCKDFITAIGGYKNYGAFVEGPGYTPVDTILSLGAYTLESWQSLQNIAFKRNPNWVEFLDNEQNNTYNLRGRYSIPGVTIKVVTGASSDPNLIFNMFLNNEIDAAGIPVDSFSTYKNDPRTTQTKGSSVFKLNVNSCTQQVWNKLFGPNGTIKPHTSVRQCKPWMSNDNFLNGLSASIDRKTFAENKGMVPSNEYFSNAYMIDPENGVSYNSTPAHAKAMRNYRPESYGYDLAYAQDCFINAVEELADNGDIEYGSSDNPTVLDVECWWMDESEIDDYGDEIAKYMEDAFNDACFEEYGVKLDIVNSAVASAMQIYDQHLETGDFDLGLGAISGNTLDPLNFMEVLKSDNSSGFTLNWGPDTSVVSENLIYDGKCWSFDGLWTAVDHGGVFEAGKLVDPAVAKFDVANSVISATNPCEIKIEWADKNITGVTLTVTRVDVYVLGYGNITLDASASVNGNQIVIDFDNAKFEEIENFMKDAMTESITGFDYSYWCSSHGTKLFDKSYYGSTYVEGYPTWNLEVYFNLVIEGNPPKESYVTVTKK